MSKNLSQKDHVLYWLKAGRSMTPKEAYELYGIMRLAPIIFELREEGYQISNISKEKYAEYYLVSADGKLNL